MARDDGLAVSAFVKLNRIRTDQWPMVAAYLLASGFDGPALVSMASLDRNATVWDVAPLVPDLMREIDTPPVDWDEAALVFGATWAAADPESAARHRVVRLLGMVSPFLDHFEGLLGECFYAVEFFDDDPDRATALEHRLRTAIRLQIAPGLATALTRRW